MKVVWIILITLLLIGGIVGLIVYLMGKEGYKSKPISNKQIRFKKTLVDMKTLLDKHNIPFFLFCGTALGAHREKQFIEHDNDIDIGIFIGDIKNINKLKQLIESDNKFNIIRTFSDNNGITEIQLTHKQVKVHLDIFFIFNSKDRDYFESYSYLGQCNNKKEKKCIFKIKKFKPVQLKFMNLNIMSAPKSFLKEHYGEDWRIPKKFGYFEGISNGYYKSLI